MSNKVYVNEIWTYGFDNKGEMFMIIKVENEQATIRSLKNPEDDPITMSIKVLLKCMKYVQ